MTKTKDDVVGKDTHKGLGTGKQEPVKGNDPLPKDTKDLVDKDEGKGTIKDGDDLGAEATEAEEAEATDDDFEIEILDVEIVPFEPETRTIAEQNADLQAVAFGIPAEVEVEEDSDGEE